MPRTIGIDDWERRLDNDPTVRDAEPEPPRVKRKLLILVDECVDAEVVKWLRRIKAVKVLKLPSGTPDKAIWTTAQRQRAVLLTADRRDFLDTRRYPIQECQGLIVITGRTASERIESLRHALAKSDLISDYQRWGSARDMTIKATPAGAVQVRRFIQGEVVVEDL